MSVGVRVGNIVGVGDEADVAVGCDDGVRVETSVLVGGGIDVGRKVGGAVGAALAHATENATMRSDTATTVNALVFIFIPPMIQSA